MKEYKKKQIIKHALEFYIENKVHHSEVERKQEEKVLLEMQLDVMNLKEEYKIPFSDEEKDLAHNHWI